VKQLAEMQQRALDYARRYGLLAEDEYFYAEQNAQVVKDAEEYYRAKYHGRLNTWNLRDRHMADTLDALVKHLDVRVVSQRKWWSGRTTPILATPAPPRWAVTAN
jgi:erythromycin esterase-like protein